MHHLKAHIRASETLKQQIAKDNDKSNRAIDRYLSAIQDTPIYECVICEQTHFQKDMVDIDKHCINIYSSLANPSSAKKIALGDQICRQCQRSLSNECLPPLVHLTILEEMKHFLLLGT